MREKLCTKDTELLSVSVPPFHLPREFPQIFVTVAYIKANESVALELISSSVLNLQVVSPDAPQLILGDFNHCPLDKILKYYKYVSCPTRKGKILDLHQGCLYSKSVPLLGSSNPNCVHLIPAYRTCLQRGKVESKLAEDWNVEEAKLELEGCLDCILWEEELHSIQKEIKCEIKRACSVL